MLVRVCVCVRLSRSKWCFCRNDMEEGTCVSDPVFWSEKSKVTPSKMTVHFASLCPNLADWRSDFGQFFADLGSSISVSPRSRLRHSNSGDVHVWRCRCIVSLKARVEQRTAALVLRWSIGERLDKTITFKILLRNSLLRGPPYPVGVICFSFYFRLICSLGWNRRFNQISR